MLSDSSAGPHEAPANYGTSGCTDALDADCITIHQSRPPSPATSEDTVVDEETPLLHHTKIQRTTPLPMVQLSIILLLQLVGSLKEIDTGEGKEHHVGYYAGLIMSLYFVTEAITVLHWSRASDAIGRKPILLLGLFGTSVSMICFGLSRTFWGLVLSRCLCGLLNGNVGVMKSVMGELTDASNRAKGFSLMPAVWATGATLGPLIGGTLASPVERFPRFFSSRFWQEYPYFLPCLASGAFVFVAFGITLVFFTETAPRRQYRSNSSHSEENLLSKTSPGDSEPVPFRKLLVYPVILSIVNYMNLAFLNIAIDALLPLFLAMPISVGGLGFDTATIGYIMGSYGAFTGIFQAVFFPTFVRICGVRRLFVTGVAVFIPIFALFPIMSLEAQKFNVNGFTWACIACILCLMTLMDMSFGCIFMYITASAPNKHALGATNGLSQTAVSIARAMGPALATSLFAFSVQNNILGGYGVYAFFIVLSCFAVHLALRLPENVWDSE
ncbi:hypothetical protein H0H93_005565 [Arthromyces matolae]|nr:hypothetical protein H0H93_005565 [Arthromyces matolae]